MKRRSFIKSAAHSLMVPYFFGGLERLGLGQSMNYFLEKARQNDRVLVLIYLEGGNDGLNTIIPLSHFHSLAKVRPHVLLPENKLLRPEKEEFAFHPSLPGFRSLYEEGRLQVIHSVGYPQPSFSHFRSMDIWMSGSDSNKTVTSGWPGRYLETNYPEYPEGFPNDQMSDPLAVEIGYGSSMLFQGENASFSMVINEAVAFYELMDNPPSDSSNGLAGDKLRHIRLMAEQSQKYGKVVKEAAQKIAGQQPYPEGNELAMKLKIVSRLVAGGLNTSLYLVRLGSFDTHDNQVEGSDPIKGRHANLLKKLDEGIMAFLKDLEHLGAADRVMGMTFSEFGRRIVSNSSLGTDHGTAAPMFIFGNQSYGGSLGSPPLITGEEVYKDNLTMQYDFRQVYTSLLSQWLGSDGLINERVTMGQFDQVKVVKGSELEFSKNPHNPLKVYPNPVKDYVEVEFDTQNGNIRLELIDMNGKTVAKIIEGQWGKKAFKEMVDLSFLPSGRFIFRFWDGHNFYSRHLLKL